MCASRAATRSHAASHCGRRCHSSRYQPALALYQNTREPAFGGGAAEAGGTWANMATRCAARGGITEPSRTPSGGVAAAGGAGRAPAASRQTSAGGRKVEPTPAKRGPGACHNCDDPSHESRDCPKPCRECGSDKHRIGYHYRARTTVKTSKCFNCDEFGHESRDCPKPCGICQSTQHKSGYHLNDHLYEQGKAPAGGGADKRRAQTGRGGAGAARGKAGAN